MNPVGGLLSKVLGGLLVAALLAVGWLWFTNTNLRRDISNEQAAHSQTKANVAIASAQASAAILGNLSRVNSEQEKVNEERLASLHDRLVRAERMRAESEAAARRARRDAVPGISPAAGRVDGSTEPATGCDLNALIRYDELITWVEQTHKIETSPTPVE